MANDSAMITFPVPVEELQDKSSTVLVKKFSKGSYAWEIKLAFNKNTEDTESVVKRVQEIDTLLDTKFNKGLNVQKTLGE